MFLFYISFSADIDYRYFGIEFGGQAFVDEEGTVQLFYNMKPHSKDEARWHRLWEYSVGFKLYGLPFTYKTKPILEGSIESVPFPKDEVKLPLEKGAQERSPAFKLASGRYVLELTVRKSGWPPALKAIFFTVKSEWFFRIRRSGVCDSIAV